MVRLNKEIKTIAGEVVTPYLMEGSNVYCWDRAGKTVAKKMNDFGNSSVTTEAMVGGASVLSVLFCSTIFWFVIDFKANSN